MISTRNRVQLPRDHAAFSLSKEDVSFEDVGISFTAAPRSSSIVREKPTDLGC
jgi:hypothetical protein